MKPEQAQDRRLFHYSAKELASFAILFVTFVLLDIYTTDMAVPTGKAVEMSHIGQLAIANGTLWMYGFKLFVFGTLLVALALIRRDDRGSSSSVLLFFLAQSYMTDISNFIVATTNSAASSPTTLALLAPVIGVGGGAVLALLTDRKLLAARMPGLVIAFSAVYVALIIFGFWP